MLITDEYRCLNASLHAMSPSYGTSGAKWAMEANKLALAVEAKTLLDYGCGKGTLKEKLDRLLFNGMGGEPRPRPYRVLEYDPAVPGKEQKPLRADLVVCGDVLEHIEPECLDAVLDDIRDIARTAVFLVVATRPAQKTLADGRNAHLIVEPAEWWLPRLAGRWRPNLFRDLGGEFVMVGMAK